MLPGPSVRGSSNPTKMPTVMSGVEPRNQLSLESLVVPGLPMSRRPSTARAAAVIVGDLGEALHADVLGDAHSDEVARQFERALERQRPHEVAAIVLGRPHRLAVARAVAERLVLDDGGGAEAGIHGGEIDEWLGSRAPLARALHPPV